MRRTRVALIADCLWLAAIGLAVLALWLAPRGLAVATALGLVAAAFVLSLVIAHRVERNVQRQIAALGAAVGAAGGRELRDGVSIEAIVANLAGRLERASQFKAAFAGLEHPALVASPDGEIIGASRGLTAIEPRAAEGASIDVLFGPGYLAGGMAEEELVSLGEARFSARHRPAGAGRSVIELTPAGAFIADDDLDAFASALAGGQTGFRFDAAALAASPALRQLCEGLEALDPGVRALRHLRDGEPLTAEMRAANSGIAPCVRDLADLIGALAEDRDEHAEARAGLEAKMAAVLAAIDKYRAGVAAMAQASEGARAGLTVAGDAVRRGAERTRSVRGLGRQARGVAADAVQAAERAGRAIAGVDSATAEVDKLVAAIEDVSFRTNLLALNAAVEAARAGEKGAGFAVVADEVRQLAQTSQKTARDIRALIGTSRGQSGLGVGEAADLEKILGGLVADLENLSNETDMIAGALDESGGAINRLDAHVTSIEDAAARALALPARRQQRSVARDDGAERI